MEPSLEDIDFYCTSRRKRVTFEKCHDDYVNANAPFSPYIKKNERTCKARTKAKRSSCWRCPQGRRFRTDESEEGRQILSEWNHSDPLAGAD